jgi:predicted GNAT family N-acyltransferase
MENLVILERTPTVQEFNLLRDRVGWGRLDEAMVGLGLSKSLFSICAMTGDRVIACCRLVGDGALKVYVEELMVHPDFQKRGVGIMMMTRIMEYVRKTYEPGCSVGLFANKNLETFYKRFGFSARKPDMPGMQLHL